jgi:hypothetical protein
MRWLHFQFWLNALDMALSPRASSAITSACDTKSAPGPPHSLGTASVRKPNFEPFSMMPQSHGSKPPSIWSRSSERGRSASSENLRASDCQWRCSSFSEKSILAPEKS